MADTRQIASRLRIAGRVVAVIAGSVVIALAAVVVHIYKALEVFSNRP